MDISSIEGCFLLLSGNHAGVDSPSPLHGATQPRMVRYADKTRQAVGIDSTVGKRAEKQQVEAGVVGVRVAGEDESY